MELKTTLQFSLLLFLPFSFYAQAELAFNGIHLDESLESASPKLNEISEKATLTKVDRPIFPLAKAREAHLVCSNIKTANGIIREAVFTFADDKLTYIEARGNVYEALVNSRTDTARSYMSYDVYVADMLFLDKAQDAAWIITQEAMHTNLFTWKNPHLAPGDEVNKASTLSSQIPRFLKMGAPLDSLRQVLEVNSRFTNTEVLDGKDPNAQIQINCFGVSYLGFPRKVEARFGDNKLNVVWILTAKGEEERVREALTEEFGNPIFVNDDWEIFNNWQVALRKTNQRFYLLSSN